MPEGDTVYLAAKRMTAALREKRLTGGELRHPRLVEHDLSGLTVLGVHSVGKHLFTRFDDGRSLHTHFRMDGSWHLYRPGERWRRPGHQARAVLTTLERVAVGFCLHDMALVATRDEHRLVGHLGPDLLNPDWDSAAALIAAQRLRENPEVELGLALLDQRIMAGVGNLYKTEMCFLLGISPWALVRDVDPDAVVALARRLLLANADRPEQSTTGELVRGKQHWVYERGGQPCRRCGQRVIRAVQGEGVHTRHTYYCPRCQPGPHPSR
jgi:endonuclease-8